MPKTDSITETNLPDDASFDTPKPETKEHESPTHEQISERAYSLWESGGCLDGSHDHDWERAKQELMQP